MAYPFQVGHFDVVWLGIPQKPPTKVPIEPIRLATPGEYDGVARQVLGMNSSKSEIDSWEIEITTETTTVQKRGRYGKRINRSLRQIRTMLRLCGSRR